MKLARCTPLPAAPLALTRLTSPSEAAPRLSPPLLAALGVALALLLLSVVWTQRASSRAALQALSGRSKAARRHLGLSHAGEKHPHVPAPPVVTIPRHIQLSEAGHEAYARALEEHGDVIVVPRHGRLEYVVDYQHVKDVLTDSQRFSFEEAVTRMLHMRFMLWFKQGTFVSELDRLVQDGINPRLNAVVDKVSPIFVQEVEELFEKHATAGAASEVVIENLYTWVHRGIARAMVVLILGERHLDEKMTQRFMAVVGAIADLSGIYENTHGWAWAPALWSLKTTLGAISFTIVPQFFFSIVPLLWRNRESHLNAGLDVDSTAFAPFFDLLAARHRNRATDQLSFLNFVWCAVVCLGIIFASVHQSAVMAVWCIANLAKRPEYIDEIRAEFDEVLETDAEGKSVLGLEGLRRSEKLDSFIREVLRTNSSLFAPVRYTTEPVRVGKYLIPKDALVAPYIKRAHELGDGAAGKGASFDGRQWVGVKAAVTGDAAFITFGLGRWACPGRQLAIAELKMITGILFAHYDVELDGDELVPGDAMNRTSVGPTNTARIRKRAGGIAA